MKRMTEQICIALNIYLWDCLLWEIFVEKLALKKSRSDNNSNRNPKICNFSYN